MGKISVLKQMVSETVGVFPLVGVVPVGGVTTKTVSFEIVLNWLIISIS